MENGNLLAIDQSFSCTGLVILGSDGHVIYFECIKTTNEDSLIVRAKTIADRIDKLYNDYNCTAVVTESLALGSIGNATRDLAGLLFILRLRFYENHGVEDLNFVTPTSVKKFATGYGGSKKQKVTKKHMMDALPQQIYDRFYAQYLRSKGLGDLADAYWIGMYWLNKIKNEAAEAE